MKIVRSSVVLCSLMAVLGSTACRQSGTGTPSATESSTTSEPESDSTVSLAVRLAAGTPDVTGSEAAWVTKALLICGDNQEVLNFEQSSQHVALFRNISQCAIELQTFTISDNRIPGQTRILVYENSGRQFRGATVFTLVAGDAAAGESERLVQSRVVPAERCIDGCRWTELSAEFRYSELLQERITLSPGDLGKVWVEPGKDHAPVCKITAQVTCADPRLVRYRIRDCHGSDHPVEFAILNNPDAESGIEQLHMAIDASGLAFTGPSAYEGSFPVTRSDGTLRFALRFGGGISLQQIDLSVTPPQCCDKYGPGQSPSQSGPGHGCSGGPGQN